MIYILSIKSEVYGLFTLMDCAVDISISEATIFSAVTYVSMCLIMHHCNLNHSVSTETTH